MVQNRFICGLSSEKIRTALLSEATDNTSPDQMLEKALSKKQATQWNSFMISSVSYVQTMNFNYSSSSAKSSSKPSGAILNEITRLLIAPKSLTPLLYVNSNQCTLRAIASRSVDIVSRKDTLLRVAPSYGVKGTVCTMLRMRMICWNQLQD